MRKVITTQMPKSFCKCGYKLDRATAKEPIKAGDLSVCFNCGNITEWTGEGKLKQISAEEIAANPIVYAEATRLRDAIVKRGPIRRKSGVFNPVFNPFSTN